MLSGVFKNEHAPIEPSDKISLWCCSILRDEGGGATFVTVIYRVISLALFSLGGGLVSLGRTLQDLLPHYLGPARTLTTEEILRAVLDDNRRASWARRLFPRRRRHPVVLAVMCMDPRLDAHVVLGDTRDYYDVIRVPGTVLSTEVSESMELAVQEHGVRVILVTTHTDCAMERIAEGDKANRYPVLSRGVARRVECLQEFAGRPSIAALKSAGDLAIVLLPIDTGTGKFLSEKMEVL